MRVGSIVYATNQGLGILAKSFFDHGIINSVFIVEHSRHPTQWSWYPPDVQHCPIRELDRESWKLRRFVDGLDVLFCFETPFYWPIIDYCRSHGVKTVLCPMYECTPERLPARFDEYWCPSLLDLRYFCVMHIPEGDRVPPFEACKGFQNGDSVCRFTPIPVDVQWKQRHTATTFVHNTGHGGLKGRNGTRELLDAMDFVKSPIKLILRSQEPILGDISCDNRIDFRIGTFPQEELYAEGDVFIFPEKFNGLSLPLQEARAAGMLVMTTDRYPMNTWLPTGPLIPITTTVKNRIGPPYNEFDEAVINPRQIAQTIDEWFLQDIHEYSLNGLMWAQSMSWNVLGPKYKTLLENLV